MPELIGGMGMKALALAVALTASQAQAATYGFSFTTWQNAWGVIAGTITTDGGPGVVEVTSSPFGYGEGVYTPYSAENFTLKDGKLFTFSFAGDTQDGSRIFMSRYLDQGTLRLSMGFAREIGGIYENYITKPQFNPGLAFVPLPPAWVLALFAYTMVVCARLQVPFRPFVPTQRAIT